MFIGPSPRNKTTLEIEAGTEYSKVRLQEVRREHRGCLVSVRVPSPTVPFFRIGITEVLSKGVK